MRLPGLSAIVQAPSVCACVAGLLLLAAPVTASGEQNAQGDSRTSLLSAEREKKASDTKPPERSVVERTLYWYDNQSVLEKISAGWHGFHLAGGGFPAGAGLKFGVGYDHVFGPADAAQDTRRSNRVGVDARAAYSTRGYMRGAVGFSVRNIGNAPLDLTVRGQYYEYPQEDFFGLGADSRKDDRTDYLLEASEASAQLHWKPVKFVQLGGGITYIDPRIGSGTDSRYPSTEHLFDPDTLPGFGTQPDFLRNDAGAALDWRDNPLHPHAGGHYGVQFSNYRDQDLDAFGFQRVAIDLQQYVPLTNRYRTLAFRAAAVFTDAGEGQQVPFYFQPTLGGSQELRGFREFRFRDQNSLLLSAEYRWEAWWALDGALFVDAGQVAAARRDLSLRDLDLSYGIGFRVHSNDAFAARLDLAFSREGFIPLLRFEHVF